MLPGLFLTGLYLVYLLGWGIIYPKEAPKLRPDQYRVTVPDYLRQLERGRSGSVVPGLIVAGLRPAFARAAGGYKVVAHNLLALAVPLLLTVGTLAGAWWYVVIYNAQAAVSASGPAAKPATGAFSAAAPQEIGRASCRERV